MIMMRMDWPEVTVELYDEVRRLVNWEGDKPPGGVFHVAAVGDDGLHVTDVWQSAEEFQRFADDRLMPGVKEVGLTTEPNLAIYPVHAVFAPAYESSGQPLA
jgi:hypothetical protein